MRESSNIKLLPEKKKIRLFDVGSGDCRHLNALSDSKNFTCSGIEINPALVRRGCEMGFQIYGGTLESMDIADHRDKYDLITMYHVLEHVQDPVIVMHKAYSMLREGGYVVGQLPSVDSVEHKWFGSSWAGYHFPRHTFVYSRSGLCELFGRSGFEVIKIRSAPHCQTAISLQNVIQKTGFKMRLLSGRSFLYPFLLFLSLMFEGLTTIFDRGGTVDFVIRK
ncbi:class I SAM-dependent methyltransferase [Litoricolaceae bacterium]|nr:class I SAM-dependent methyltransferase [Litorivicinaceae bacterium]